MHAPRAERRAVEVGLQLAGRENPVALCETEPATEFAGTAGILPQRELLDPPRQVALCNSSGMMRSVASAMCGTGLRRRALRRRPATMAAVVGGK